MTLKNGTQVYIACHFQSSPGYQDTRIGNMVLGAFLIFFMNHALMNGNPVSQDDLIGVFTQEWANNIDTNHIEWRNLDECGDLLMKGTELLGVYYEKFRSFKPRDVEMEFRLPLLDLCGLYVGSRDLVAK